MNVPFTKMQGTGNDFIVVDNTARAWTVGQLSELAKQTCARRFSVGADTLIALEKAKNNGDFFARFFNADGSEAEMCGNGARCIARFAYDTGAAKKQMVIETIAGDVPAERVDQRTYCVQLNSPTVFHEDTLVHINGNEIRLDYVELGSPGIPHLVVPYPELAQTELSEIFELARQLRQHPQFPKGANVNFYDIAADGTVVERTYERGVEDFTLACGTGTGSTAYALAKKGLVAADRPVIVAVLGGQLHVRVDGEKLFLIGDTNRVAAGVITDDDLHV